MIITDEASLRIKCEPVLLEEVDELRTKLERALEWSAGQGRPGIGLACPQIGIGKQMCIIRLGAIKIDLVNASITKSYNQFEFDNEGCLSYPDRFEKTLRFKEVLIEDNLVPPHRFVLTDLLAVIAQHEIGHINGILLSDVAIK